MANSGDTMATDVGDLKRDLGDIKTAAWKSVEILTEQTEQLARLQRTLDEGLDGIERRLARLEERAGI